MPSKAQAARAELLGVKECREALQELSKTVQKNVGKRALRVAAGVIGNAAQGLAPVSSRPTDPSRGSLRDSMRIVDGKSRRLLATVAILFEEPAAVPNEYGTSKMAAQPFFRPAIDANERAAMAAFEPALKAEIVAAAERAAAKKV